MPNTFSTGAFTILGDHFPALLDQELTKELGAFLNGGKKTTAVINFGEQLLSTEYHEKASKAIDGAHEDNGNTDAHGKIPVLLDINFCEALKDAINRASPTRPIANLAIKKFGAQILAVSNTTKVWAENSYPALTAK